MNSNKFSDLQTRVFSAIVLFLIQALVIAAGPRAIFVELLVIQFTALYEFVRVAKSIANLHPIIKSIPYCLSIILTYYLSIKTILLDIFPPLLVLHPGILKYKGIVSFSVALGFLVAFVILLEPGTIQSSISYLGWSIIGNIVITIPANLFVQVSYTSLFWFTFVIILVIVNDTAAYFCGRLFGRHPLIHLSPKKTVEGFVGAAVITTIVGHFLPLLFKNTSFLTCASVKPFQFHVTCMKPFEFIKKTYKIAGLSISCYPSQFHGMVFALFASLVAPFGGFLASGIKRACGIKDFGDLIPGHGGVVDRCDCQFLMATFTYFYLFDVIKLI